MSREESDMTRRGWSEHFAPSIESIERQPVKPVNLIDEAVPQRARDDDTAAGEIPSRRTQFLSSRRGDFNTPLSAGFA